MMNKGILFTTKLISPIKQGILRNLTFKSNCLITFWGNIIYLVVIYYLWKSIFASSAVDVVNGMTFNETMIYLVLAAAMFNMMNSMVSFHLGQDYQSGNIVITLIKPMDFQLYSFLVFGGQTIVKFFLTFFPTFLVVVYIARGELNLGINMLFFFLSMLLSILINYQIDFFVGILCFYTHSIWGLNIVKDTIVAFLSGATIPLAFFPKSIYRVIKFLPFQAIYDKPLNILMSKTCDVKENIYFLLLQVMWLVICTLISRIALKCSAKKIIINGG